MVDREQSPSTTSNHEDTEFYPGHEDLVNEFTATGWSGDLRGALNDAPFSPPPTDDVRRNWKPLFRDYLRGLPDHTRTKYAIREADSMPESQQ